MIQIEVHDLTRMIAFWLAFSRWLTVIFQVPILDDHSVPMLIKILISLLMTYAFFPQVEPYLMQDIQLVGEDHFWVLTLFYSLSGLVIGFLIKVILDLFVGCGTVVSQNMGFGAMRFFDPTLSQMVGPFEKLLYWVVMVLIALSGAFIPIIKGIFLSFKKINCAHISYQYLSIPHYMDFLNDIFTGAILLSMPIIILNLVLNIIMGLTNKMIPQMNILMVSFVVQIGLGLSVFAMISQDFFTLAFQMYCQYIGQWFNFII